MSWADVVANVNAIIAALSGIGTAGGGVLLLLWRVSKWFAKMEAGITDLKAELADLRREIGVREKDHTKLEGKIELQQTTLMQMIAGLQQATGSLDALWKTLQMIFPERVPKRASDR